MLLSGLGGNHLQRKVVLLKFAFRENKCWVAEYNTIKYDGNLSTNLFKSISSML